MVSSINGMFWYAKTHEHAVYIFHFKYSAYSIYYAGALETVCKIQPLLTDVVTHNQEANKLQG